MTHFLLLAHRVGKKQSKFQDSQKKVKKEVQARGIHNKDPGGTSVILSPIEETAASGTTNPLGNRTHFTNEMCHQEDEKYS